MSTLSPLGGRDKACSGEVATPVQNTEPLLVFHGASIIGVSEGLDPEIQAILNGWRARSDQDEPAPEPFHLADVTCLILDRHSEPKAYYPSASSNRICETLTRTFLFPEGVGNVLDQSPFVLEVDYELIALKGRLRLLICPFGSRSGPLSGGIVVIDLERRLIAARRACRSSTKRAQDIRKPQELIVHEQ